jgi:hypothetical protein
MQKRNPPIMTNQWILPESITLSSTNSSVSQVPESIRIWVWCVDPQTNLSIRHADRTKFRPGSNPIFHYSWEFWWCETSSPSPSIGHSLLSDAFDFVCLIYICYDTIDRCDMTMVWIHEEMIDIANPSLVVSGRSYQFRSLWTRSIVAFSVGPPLAVRWGKLIDSQIGSVLWKWIKPLLDHWSHES